MPTPTPEPADTDPPDDDLLSSLEDRLVDSGLDPLIALTEIVTGPSNQSSTLGLHGRDFGGARLEQILGAGGMGITYRGLLQDGTKVAVKILRRVGAEERERFENECTILSTLEHPSVVRYHSHGFADDGRAFLVMDLVDGVTLEQVLLELEDEEKVLSPPALSMCGGARPSSRTDRVWLQRIAGFCRQIAGALAHAHERGVVHRDVKPANLIVRPDGTPVLVDFGLGRDLEREVTMTRTGAVVGTVGWMAPEQFDSSASRVGPSTDVYALGLLLYRLWTGRDLRLDLDDIVRFRSGPLRLSRAESDGLGLAELGVLYGCLEPEPGRRYPDGAVLASELGALAEGGSPKRRPPGWIGRWVRREGVRSWKRAGYVAAVALMGLLVWALWPEAKRVYVCSIEDDQRGDFLDVATGEWVGLSVPIYDWRTSRSGVGRFELTNRSVRDMPFEIDFERDTPSAVLLTVPSSLRRRAVNGSDQIDDRGLVDFVTFDPSIVAVHVGENRFDVDSLQRIGLNSSVIQRGADELAARGVQFLMPPGVHDLQVMHADGHVEPRTIQVHNQQIVTASGPNYTYGVEGVFRRQLANVVQPLPEWCELSMAGSAAYWLDSGGQALTEDPDETLDPVAKAFENRSSSITVVHPGEPGSVHLTVRFSSRMRSMLVAIPYRFARAERAEFFAEWKTAVSEWRPISVARYRGSAQPTEHPAIGVYHASDMMVLDVADLPSPGTDSLEMRFEIQDPRAPREVAVSRVLEGYVLVGRPWNALEIVADPSPEPRRLR